MTGRDPHSVVMFGLRWMLVARRSVVFLLYLCWWLLVCFGLVWMALEFEFGTKRWLVRQSLRQKALCVVVEMMGERWLLRQR